jgi:hypothetical protein
MKFKLITATLLTLLITATTAYAGVMEVISTVVKAEAIWVGVGALVIAYILKRVPNDKIQAAVYKTVYGLFRVVTLNLSKFKYTAPFWEKYIEPWLIDLIDNTLVTATKAAEEALRSDNTLEVRNNNG